MTGGERAASGIATAVTCLAIGTEPVRRRQARCRAVITGGTLFCGQQ